MATRFTNPFRPGAGHMPPYLAGRTQETKEFLRLLTQNIIMENLVLTGLRGTGKTVLLDTFKPLAIKEGWLWVGTDLSESTSISEERIAIRLITDLAVVTSGIVVRTEEIAKIGFQSARTHQARTLNFELMCDLYKKTPGLVSDKLKTVLELVWQCLRQRGSRGVIFAYDEAQNLSDHAAEKEFPLSLLLDLFQSIQKKEIPFMLVLVGLPTLFPKLVEARTFAERMFRVVPVDRLKEADSKDAIQKPIQDSKCPVNISDGSVQLIISESGGYPYFIQFICREVYDVFVQKVDAGQRALVPIADITRKLDSDFFAGRWARATDRQRELLIVIAHLETADREFTVQAIAEKSHDLPGKPFSPSHISQMLVNLCDSGLVYKNRHGKYSFAVPLLGRFISRQLQEEE
ncbi:MAG TPA: AAA family ATPase [Gemmataceae bacterium]|nr:AAA family ATPase [Gemmataceae bacterium]